VSARDHRRGAASRQVGLGIRLILASASPRRRVLLARLGLAFDVLASGVVETIESGISPPEAATALALAKARDIAARAGPAVVLGADTLVAVDGRALGKPASRDEARAMLRALRARAHEVITAVAVVEAPSGREAVETVVSRVVMRAYPDGEIDAYVATGEPDDKAGAYAVQGDGARLVAAVDGCYTNVVGLPVKTTARLLRAFGLAPCEPAPGRP
jgi:septum formation protein